jgi:pimeloyl-ACP methyl ester carboxylesterase
LRGARPAGTILFVASVVRAGSRIEYEVTGDEPLPGWMREVMLRADGHTPAFQLLADAGEMSPLSDLGLVTTPALLLLVGEHDPRLRLIRITGDRLRQAEVAVLPGCGHFDTFARADLTVPLVREFLGRPRP